MGAGAALTALRKDNPDDAIVRVEQLYPFPGEELEEIKREIVESRSLTIKTNNLGKVLATPTKYGIYYWNVEKKAFQETAAK